MLTNAELIEVSTGCACRAARRAAREVTRRYDDALRPAGLRTTQFSLLVAIERHGEPSLSTVAATLGTERTTVTRELATLERRGLVAVRPADGDGRSRVVAVTGPGREAMAAAFPHWRSAQRALADAPGMAAQLDRIAAEVAA